MRSARHSAAAVAPAAARLALLPLLALLALSVATSPLAAQAATPALPTAKSLMDKHDAAIGGRAALAKYSSVKQSGAMTIPAAGLDASIEIFKEKSGMFLQKITIGPIGEIAQGFDGKTAWGIQPQVGAMVLEGEQAREMKAQGEFFGNFHDMANYKSAETVELVDFEGRKCYKVKLSRVAGGEGFEFFDAATGLTAGAIREIDVPGQGKILQTSVFFEYKDFGGVKIPTKIAQRGGQLDVTVNITAVEYDKVDPSTFVLPDAVKSLVKP
jgi:hypothetical protein